MVGAEDLGLREEPDNEAVQALRAGDDLHNHRFTELGRILGNEASARFAGDAGALSRADACEKCCEGSAEQADCEAADGFHK